MTNIGKILEVTMEGGIPLAVDNQCCISCTLDEGYRIKYRQVAIHFHIIKDYCRDKHILPVKINTDYNCSDILTKRVQTDKKFNKLASGLLNGGGIQNSNLRIFEEGYGLNGELSFKEIV